MVDEDDDTAALESRPPTIDDLRKLCNGLNEAGAAYVVVGGMAVIRLGLVRATEDIDLLVDASAENMERVCRGMMVLPDGAARDVRPGDVEQYVVVRVADEVVVDLMKAACGIAYDEAAREVEVVDVDGVPVPFASARLLLRTKQTYRDKDRIDRLFLEEIIRRGAT